MIRKITPVAIFNTFITSRVEIIKTAPLVFQINSLIQRKSGNNLAEHTTGINDNKDVW